MNVLGEFKGYRNKCTKDRIISKVKTGIIGMFFLIVFLIIFGLSYEFDNYIKTFIQVLVIVGLFAIVCLVVRREIKEHYDGSQKFVIHKNENNNLTITGRNRLPKIYYTTTVYKIAFIQDNTFETDKVEERFKAEIKDNYSLRKNISLFVFYHSEEDKTLREIIQENNINVEMVDTLD